MEDLLTPNSKPRISEIGFSVLHDAPNATADIVFVHGLQGHPHKTWTRKGVPVPEPRSTKGTNDRLGKLLSWRPRSRSRDTHKPDDDEVFWPLDLLAKDCVDSRVLVWGYDSKVSHFFGGAANKSNITAYARNLLHALKVIRLSFQGRRIIFVAHSLGGIIVKNVIWRAESDADPIIIDIYTSTEAIIFLGTPHRGSGKVDLGETVRKIVSVSGFDTTDTNIRALQVNSSELELFHELFIKVYEQKDRSFKAITFQEGKGVPGISYLKLNEKVVETFSSSLTGTELTQTINANHMDMCRFTGKDDEGYRQILGEIQKLLLDIKTKGQVTVEQNKTKVTSAIDSPSQATMASAVHSLNDVERKCIALLIQNTSNAAE